MSKDNNLHDFLQDVADAIRKKKGTSEPINAQSFSEEIRNLPSGSSPFAVDFGEDVAAQSTAMMDTLKEDIAYYYEIERQRAAGEVTDQQLLTSQEFKKRIAWLPKGMTLPGDLGEYTNLRVLKGVLPKFMYNVLTSCPRHLSEIDLDASQVTDLGLFLNSGSIECPFYLTFDSVTQTRLQILQNVSGKEAHLILPNVTTSTTEFFRSSQFDVIELSIPRLTKGSNIIRDGRFREIYADISSMISASYCFYNNRNNTEICMIKGLQTSINMSFGTKIGIDSIKYILDNCQSREDGASYTLTLNAAVKTAFLAKCDEDSEYAASLASANAKGLTLA